MIHSNMTLQPNSKQTGGDGENRVVAREDGVVGREAESEKQKYVILQT